MARRPQKSGNRGTSLRSVTITHTELLDTLSISAGAWDIVGKSNGYALNAGSSFTFPWMSGIARHYEKYNFSKLNFTMKTASPKTYGGRLHMAVDPDTTDAAPMSSAQMLSYPYTATSVVHENCSLTIGAAGCAALHRPFGQAFVKERDGGDAYPRSSTVGRLFLAAAVDQDVTVEIFVSYTVHLFQPQLVLGDVSSQYASTECAIIAAATKYYPAPAVATGAIKPVNRGGVECSGIPLSAIRGKLMEVGIGIKDLAGAMVVGASLPTPDRVGLSVLDKDGVELGEIDSTNAALASYNFSQMNIGGPYESHSDGYSFLVDKSILYALWPLATTVVPWLLSAVNVATARLQIGLKAEL